jgi:hypothetical protein
VRASLSAKFRVAQSFLDRNLETAKIGRVKKESTHVHVAARDIGKIKERAWENKMNQVRPLSD